MRRPAAIVLLLFAAACHKPSFDERYEKAEKAVRDKAAAIDRDLQAQASESASAPASP